METRIEELEFDRAGLSTQVDMLEDQLDQTEQRLRTGRLSPGPALRGTLQSCWLWLPRPPHRYCMAPRCPAGCGIACHVHPPPPSSVELTHRLRGGSSACESRSVAGRPPFAAKRRLARAARRRVRRGCVRTVRHPRRILENSRVMILI